jgi:hypothetical protein
MDMSQTMYRNKNRNKTLIDYDLNIYMPEEYDDISDEYYFDPSNWKIHVYIVNDRGHEEWDEPLHLTAEEIRHLGLNRESYFKDEQDVWYGLEGFRLDYWDRMSDRLKEYFDRLPKYVEDVGP